MVYLMGYTIPFRPLTASNTRLIRDSLISLLITLLITEIIVARLRVEQTPKSEFGIVPLNGFDSHTYCGAAGYDTDESICRGSADVLG